MDLAGLDIDRACEAGVVGGENRLTGAGLFEYAITGIGAPDKPGVGIIILLEVSIFRRRYD